MTLLRFFAVLIALAVPVVAIVALDRRLRDR